MTGIGLVAGAGFNAFDLNLISRAIGAGGGGGGGGGTLYKSVIRNGTGAVPWIASGAGFAPDMSIMSGRNLVNFSAPTTYQHSVIDRLRNATEHIQTVDSAAEGGGWGAGHILNMDGYNGNYAGDDSFYNASGGTYIDHFFRRAPGFFDVVCYTGTGAATTVAHGLGVVPELMIVKKRSSSTNSSWIVYSSALGNDSILILNTTVSTQAASGAWNTTTPTATSFALGANAFGNESSATFVNYLFATLPGISKVFSFTGNGGSQTINCGFTTGARFILIKRTDRVGNWYVWDSARGIPVSGNSPHISLNTDAAEVTTDASVNFDNSGFVVTQNAATNINVGSATYIGLAIA